MSSVILAIAKDNPQHALDEARALNDADFEDGVYYRSVLDSMDFDAAISWIDQLDDPVRRKQLRRRALSNNDLDRSIAETLKLDDKAMRLDILTGVLQQLALSNGRKAATYLATLPLEELEGGVLLRAGQNMGLRDRGEAMAVGAALPEDRRSEFFAGILHVTVEENAAHFVAQVDALVAPGKDRNELYERAATAWAMRDVHGAGEWLAQLSVGNARDYAVEAFSAVLLESDPERALQWATTLSDVARRDAQVGSLLGKWRKKDPPTAEAWTKSHLIDRTSETPAE
jgi:hypothetical protein